MEVLGDLLPVLMTVSSWPLESGEAGRWLVFVGVVPRAEIGGPGFQAGEFLPSAGPEAEGSGWGGGTSACFPLRCVSAMRESKPLASSGPILCLC